MKKLLSIFTLLFLTNCTDAFWDSNIGKLGKRAKIKCYSGVKLIFEGESTGSVKNATNSDGYQFREKGTNRFLEVSGKFVSTWVGFCTIVIVLLPSALMTSVV